MAVFFKNVILAHVVFENFRNIKFLLMDLLKCQTEKSTDALVINDANIP